MTNLTLYHNGPSTCSQKVRLILGLKGLEYESKLIDLIQGEQHDPEYVKLNPNHVVPTLVTSDSVLIESSLIIEYLEDAYPEISAKPKDPEQIHQMRLWIKNADTFHQFGGLITYGIAVRNLILAKSPEEREADINIIPDPLKRKNRRELVEKGIESKAVQDAIKKSYAFVKKLEMELPDSGWLSGSSFGLGDAAVVPYVTRMEHLALGEIFDQNSSPKVSNWLQRIKELPFYKEAVDDHIPEPLLGMLNKFGSDLKEDVIQIMKS